VIAGSDPKRADMRATRASPNMRLSEWNSQTEVQKYYCGRASATSRLRFSSIAWSNASRVGAGLRIGRVRQMAREEVVLFLHIIKLERHISEGTAKPRGCFGTVANPIAMMTHEHDDAGTQMAEIRNLSRDYTPAAAACPTYRGVYESLTQFEADLHRHVHLENNILFP
jgi:hypothetical protein